MNSNGQGRVSDKHNSGQAGPKPFRTAFFLATTPLWLLALLATCGGQTELPAADGVSPGYCAKACSVTADCCPEDDTACPGDYPKNFVCEGGLCRAPHCVTDEDCSFGEHLGGSGTFICGTRDGRRGCMMACATDEDCGATTGFAAGSCSGQTDGGRRICAIPVGMSSLGCKIDEDCPDGKHCQGGTCGCASDAECRPKLDVCTNDRNFAYPSDSVVRPGN